MRNHSLVDYFFKVAVIGLLLFLLLWNFKPEPIIDYTDEYNNIMYKQDSILKLIESYDRPNVTEITNHYTTIIENQNEKIDSNSVAADIELFQQLWSKAL
jgi:hypothetical protein